MLAWFSGGILSKPNMSSTHLTIVSCGMDSKAPEMSSAIMMGMYSVSLDLVELKSRFLFCTS